MKFLKQLFKYLVKKLLKIYVPDILFKSIPNEIIIEPTNVCNLKCPVCPTTYGMDRKLGFMEFDLYKSIIDDLKSYKKKPLMNYLERKIVLSQMKMIYKTWVKSWVNCR